MMFDRKKHWGDVYQEKSPSEVSWYQKEPKLSLELIRCTNVASIDVESQPEDKNTTFPLTEALARIDSIKVAE